MNLLVTPAQGEGSGGARGAAAGAGGGGDKALQQRLQRSKREVVAIQASPRFQILAA